MMPTAKPQNTLPKSSIPLCTDVAITIQPMISGSVVHCRVRLRPMASMIGPDSMEPSGVAAECMLAAKKITLGVGTYKK